MFPCRIHTNNAIFRWLDSRTTHPEVLPGWGSNPWPRSWIRVKVKVVVLESRLHDNACSTDFTFPLGKVGANAACNYSSNLGFVHQVPTTAGWTEAKWNTKFARYFCTWPALGIEPQTFWSWVQCPIHWAKNFHFHLDSTFHVPEMLILTTEPFYYIKGIAIA